MWFLYLLKSRGKNWYYVGSTNDLDRRVQEHNSGKVRSTKNFHPLACVYIEKHTTELEVRAREHEIKGKRRLKEKIIKSLSNT